MTTTLYSETTSLGGGAADGPEIVTANRSYYVATTGSDAADGSVGTPWATIQHALDFCQTKIIIENQIQVTINLANGTYDEHPFFGHRLGGGGRLWMLGNTADPTLVIIKPTTPPPYAGVLNFFFNEVFGLGGFTVDATDAGFGGSECIYGIGADFDIFHPIILKMPNDSGWFAVRFYTDCKIGFGGVTFDMPGDQAAILYMYDSYVTCGAWTITGTPNWTIAGVVLEQNSLFDYVTPSIIGTATGRRLSVIRNSIVQQYDATNTFFPGDTPYAIDQSSSIATGYDQLGIPGASQVAGVPTTTDVPIHRTASIIYDTVNDTLNVYYNADGTLKSIAGGAAPSGAPLTKTDDTNITLTLGGTPATALLQATSITVGWTGTLGAGRLNSNVVQSAVNDTNVTGSIAAQALTLGWTGTLGAARLNGNVVQSVVNDTNVTGSVATQALTLGWTGTLAVARGGLGVGTVTGLLQGNGTSAVTVVANSVTVGQVLRVTGSNTYGWGAVDLADTDAVTGTLPVTRGGTGITALGTGVATALGLNVGSAGAPVTFNGALGTPSAGTVTNLTGTASININGTVGATTPAAGSFTTVATNGAIIESEVNLTDAANVTLNAVLGNTFKLVAAGNRQIDAPTNKPASGKVQKIVIMHEASGADRTLTLQTGVSGGFRFGTDITGLTATASGLADYIGCIYSDADDRWDVVSYVKGLLMGHVGLILDSYGGCRTVVANAESMEANASASEWVHVVPNLVVKEPITWDDIPFIIERARLEFEKWLDTRPNLEEDHQQAVTLYWLRKQELNQRSLDLSTIVET